MNFKEEFKKVSLGILPYEFSISSGGGYFIGVKKLLTVEINEISLTVANCKITVTGENLKITKFIEGDLAFKGKVLKVERSGI